MNADKYDGFSGDQTNSFKLSRLLAGVMKGWVDRNGSDLYWTVNILIQIRGWELRIFRVEWVLGVRRVPSTVVPKSMSAPRVVGELDGVWSPNGMSSVDYVL